MKKRNILLTVLASMMALSLSGCKGDERYPRTFTVNFETGEGGEVIESQVVKEGYLISGIDEPDHEKEHIFKGWYLDEAYTQYFDIENHRVFDDITLYAKWGEAPVYTGYYKGFNTYGSTSVGSAQSITIDEEGNIFPKDKKM